MAIRRVAEARPTPAGSAGLVEPAVLLERATVRVGGRIIWRDVDVSIGRGEFAAILGPNGVGKSTLVKALLGLVPLAGGRVSVLGRPPGQARHEIGYLPQRRHFDAGVRVRGLDLVRLGVDGDRWGVPLPGLSRFSRRRRAATARVAEAVAMVGATGYARRPVGELSGGEQQRLLIAQALVRRPSLLLLDEPLDSLDLPNQASVVALLEDVCRVEGVSVVIVAHDVNPLLPYLDKIVYLAPTGVAAGSPREVVTSETLTALYGTPIEVMHTSDGRLVVVGQPEAPAMHADRHAG